MAYAQNLPSYARHAADVYKSKTGEKSSGHTTITTDAYGNPKKTETVSETPGQQMEEGAKAQAVTQAEAQKQAAALKQAAMQSLLQKQEVARAIEAQQAPGQKYGQPIREVTVAGYSTAPDYSTTIHYVAAPKEAKVEPSIVVRMGEEKFKQQQQEKQKAELQKQQEMQAAEQQKAKILSTPSMISLGKKQEYKGISTPEQYAQQEQLNVDNSAQKFMDTQIYAAQGSLKKIGGAAGQVAVPFAIGAVTTAGTIIGHPIKTAGSVVNFVLHPIKETRNIQASLTEMTQTKGEEYTLSYLGGSYVGGSTVFKGVKYLAGKSPIKFEYENMVIPTKEGDISIGRTFGIKYKEYGYPLISTARGGRTAETWTIFRGKPEYTQMPEIYGAYQPKTAVGAYIYEKNIGQFITKPTRISETQVITPQQYAELNVKSIEAAKQLARQKSLFTEEEILKTGTKTLPKTETVQAALKIFKKEKGIVFGSKATQPQLISDLRRVPGDIDVYFKTASENKLLKIAQRTLKEIQKTEPSAKLEEFHITTKYGKAIEFKGRGIGDTAETVPARAFGYDLNVEKNVMKLGKNKAASLRGETPRKLAATVRVQQGIDVKGQPIESSEALAVAHPGRFKDIPDYLRMIQTQAESAKIIGKGYSKGEQLINYAEDLGIKPLKSANEQIIIYQPSPPTPKVSGGSPAIGTTFSGIVRTPQIKRISPFIISQSPSGKSAKSPYVSPSIKTYTYASPSPSPSPKISSVSYSPSPSPGSPSPGSPSPSPSPSPGSPSPKYILSPSAYVNPFEKKKKRKFTVKVRKKGIFQRIGEFETEKTAFFAGQKRVLGTSTASFKVEEEGKIVKPSFFDRRFYQSRREPGVSIQKRQFRISSAGEKREITFKGLTKLRFMKGGF